MTPTHWRKTDSRFLELVKVTSINQAKKLIFVVNTLLFFLRSRSDSLIPDIDSVLFWNWGLCGLSVDFVLDARDIFDV